MSPLPRTIMYNADLSIRDKAMNATRVFLIAAILGCACPGFLGAQTSGPVGPAPEALASAAEGWTLGGTLGLLLEENPTTGETDLYAQIGFQPEFSIGQFGLGLNITLYYNVETNEFKESEYNETEDYLKLIRYVRYGKSPRKEGVYLKAGELDSATVGHGFIINRYKTDVDYDNRRAGLQCNLNYGYWGIETFTNNLFLGEVVGVRGIVRPLAGIKVPKIRELGFGMTYATDRSAPYTLQDTKTWDPDAEQWTAGADGVPDWDADNIFIVDERNRLSIVGVDAELPVFRGDILELILYADYAQMRDVGTESGAFSSGTGVGFLFNFTLTSGNKLYLKTERRFIDSNFIPGYFDGMYEIERVQFSTDSPLLTKQAYLEGLPDGGRYKGIYAEVVLELLSTLQVWGTFEENQEVPNDGKIKMGLGFKDLKGISCAAEYTRRDIADDDINDMFTLDDRSLFTAYLGYKLNVFMNLGMVFRREWALNETTGEYEPVDSYNVAISFNTTF